MVFLDGYIGTQNWKKNHQPVFKITCQNQNIIQFFTQDVGDATFCAPHALKLAEVFNFTFKVSSYISMGLEAGVGFRKG